MAVVNACWPGLVAEFHRPPRAEMTDTGKTRAQDLLGDTVPEPHTADAKRLTEPRGFRSAPAQVAWVFGMHRYRQLTQQRIHGRVKILCVPIRRQNMWASPPATGLPK